MSNTSATGGYLTPSGAAPLYDLDLDLFLQTVFVGLSGLPGAMVRPRYQPTVPKQPAANVDWCAVGVMDIDKDDNPVVLHSDDGDGSSTLIRHEEIHVLASFYGPNSARIADTVRDGLYLGQNNEALSLQLMLYVNNDTIRQVPELVNEQWIRRRDLPILFRRQVKRTYAVQNLVSADSSLIDITTVR